MIFFRQACLAIVDVMLAMGNVAACGIFGSKWSVYSAGYVDSRSYVLGSVHKTRWEHSFGRMWGGPKYFSAFYRKVT